MKKLKPQAIAQFFRQFATLFQAGIPIAMCCDILSESQHNKAVNALTQSIKQDLLQGRSLYWSLKKHHRDISRFICHLIHIGEQTGKLDDLLDKIATHLEQSLALRSRIKQLLFYPSLVLMTALMVTVAMFVFIIPRFAELFYDQLNQLPWLTRLIFYLSDFLRNNYLVISICILIAILFIRHVFKSTHYDKLPIISKHLTQLDTIHFIRSLSICLSSGIHLSEAISLCQPSRSSSPLRKVLPRLSHQLHAGNTLYQTMLESCTFPAFVLQLVHIGETSGTLDHTLTQAATTLESEMSYHIDRLTKLAEPLIMVVLGVVIGGIVIGMYLPIFNLGSAI